MRLILIILCTAFTIQMQAQQAWTRAQGQGYAQLGWSYFGYDMAFGADGSAEEIPRSITQSTLALYAEYGLTDRLMLTSFIPFNLVSSGELSADWTGFAPAEGSLSALGNLNLGITYNVLRSGSSVISVQSSFAFNSSDYDADTGLRTGVDAFTISPSLLWGLGTDHLFLSAEAGVHIRSNDYLNQFLFNAQIGTEFGESKKLIGIITANALLPLGDADPQVSAALDGNSAFTYLYLNEVSYITSTFKLGYKIASELTLWGSVGGGPGENLGRNPVFTLSVGSRF